MELTCFYAVLQEHSSAHDMVDHVVLNHDIMSVMNVDSSVECPVNTTSPHVRAILVSVEMEVDRIPSQSKCLSCELIHQ